MNGLAARHLYLRSRPAEREMLPEAGTGHSRLQALCHFPYKTISFPVQCLPSQASLETLIHKGEAVASISFHGTSKSVENRTADQSLPHAHE